MSANGFQRRSVLDRAPGLGIPNMTPMVDVTLVILIFFMASSTIMAPEWFLRATLPEPSQPSPALGLPSPVLRAEVFVRDGSTVVRGIGPERSMDEVIDAVHAMDPGVAGGLVVEIEPADGAPYAEVVRLHAALVASGAAVRLR